jgi:sec-independent protein translocase protein TatA
MGLSVWHLLILAPAALLIFGGSGRISSLMGDVANGIKNFRKGLSDDDERCREPLEAIDCTRHESTTPGASLQDQVSTQGPPLTDLPCANKLECVGCTAICTSHV